MGVDARCTLGLGIPMQRDINLHEILDENDVDDLSELIELKWLELTNSGIKDPLHKNPAYNGKNFDDFREQYSKYLSDKRKFFETNPIPVEYAYHGSSDCIESENYALLIPMTVVKGDWDDPKEFDPTKLIMDVNNEAHLKAYEAFWKLIHFMFPDWPVETGVKALMLVRMS